MSTRTRLPPATRLSCLPDTDRAEILDILFEPSPALHSIFLPLTGAQTFRSYKHLITATGTKLFSLAESSKSEDLRELEHVLSSHPRLGEKKVESAMSKMEQAAMLKASGEGEGGEAKAKEAETLRALNKEYEETFPGLRYVVFVNGRPRTAIFENMKSRIARGDIAEERREAIQAMCDIAEDRVKKLL
ncbi:Oxo-4-hydroxy-4-carboxy-5-ureidoimidazoline decarboxylase protein [Venturia nashicola]|uniref:Oxo-4-hydroxy-4-carboxy-5-ureidoimidazoline decarboxylase protein n=1 Tax=Venturia nashicola TaxID=86259 RepID=A0A4Z1NXT6_9PEZI|nr:Oxo-4-hydroxy-4-carboxy-5-ureidoimidazoline decarboxylase protein [Venturia nashicola]